MKIRFYRLASEPIRWLGFVLAMMSVYFLTNGVVEMLWIGWGLSTFSCMLLVYVGLKDGDLSRTAMEIIYLVLAIRGIIVWF